MELNMVGGQELGETYRQVLRPGEALRDEKGYRRVLPRFFYEIETWKAAKEMKLAPNFSLYEFITTDVREADELHGFPRYIPCALPLLATHLSVLREEVGTYVHIAANGGYRSPAHEVSRHASTHHWGTAANIYKIGDEYLDDQDTIEHYSQVVRDVLPFVWIRPYGHTEGYADDHLHLDLGYVTLAPHEAGGDQDVQDGDADKE